jgi:hypothetical protein
LTAWTSGVAVGVLPVAAPMPSLAHAGSDMLLTTFLHGQKVCCGGVNDAAHLAKHPANACRRSHLFKSLTPTPSGRRAIERAKLASCMTARRSGCVA